MKILLTAFEPFLGGDHNASEEVLKRVQLVSSAIELHKVRIPCQWKASTQVIVRLLHEIQPDIVLLMGQAADRTHLTFEEVAVNSARSTAPDTAGVVLSPQRLCTGAPAAYFATLDPDWCVATIQDAGCEVAVSDTAGRYVCNSLLYHTLHAVEQQGGTTQVGFLHVPLHPLTDDDQIVAPQNPEGLVHGEGLHPYTQYAHAVARLLECVEIS